MESFNLSTSNYQTESLAGVLSARVMQVVTVVVVAAMGSMDVVLMAGQNVESKVADVVI